MLPPCPLVDEKPKPFSPAEQSQLSGARSKKRGSKKSAKQVDESSREAEGAEEGPKTAVLKRPAARGVGSAWGRNAMPQADSDQEEEGGEEESEAKPASKKRAPKGPSKAACKAKSKASKPKAKAKVPGKPNNKVAARESCSAVCEERKARNSRKSVAYHRALKRAREEEKPEEECRAAAKKVSCCRSIYIYIYIHSACAVPLCVRSLLTMPVQAYNETE